jgi:hypothetical protein
MVADSDIGYTFTNRFDLVLIEQREPEERLAINALCLLLRGPG